MQSGFETSKCTQSGHLRFFCSMLKSPSNKPRKQQLLFCSPLPCAPWTKSSLMDSACKELLWQRPAFLSLQNKQACLGQPSTELASPFCVFSCSEVGNWSSRTLYELWLQNSPSLQLPPQRQIDSHWNEDAVYRNLLLHLSDNWTMLGLRKWWYWKQADDTILWWLQSMKVDEPTLWVTWRAVLRNKIGRFWTCFVN